MAFLWSHPDDAGHQKEDERYPIVEGDAPNLSYTLDTHSLTH